MVTRRAELPATLLGILPCGKVFALGLGDDVGILPKACVTLVEFVAVCASVVSSAGLITDFGNY